MKCVIMWECERGLPMYLIRDGLAFSWTSRRDFATRFQYHEAVNTGRRFVGGRLRIVD